jgi:hypothetical protein
MPSTVEACLRAARRLAAALDAENYDTVRACLSAGCVYHGPDGVRTGPDAIVASYRDNGTAGAGRFDRIEYESLVEAAGPAEAVITFTDRVWLGGAWHRFLCQQHVRVGASGLVEEIRHEELPGERERLARFEAEAGKGKSDLSHPQL